jgi:two-component system, OmpR family, alkaline phosphatase synthesis response regulator PhoP
MSNDLSSELLPAPWLSSGPLYWAASPSYVLVVDDDGEIRAEVSDALQSAGYQVLEAETGEEALHLLQLHVAKIGLIFLDLLLPGLSGWELRRELAKDDDLRRIPVVIMTAVPAPTHDAPDWLDKPFPVNKMLRIAERHLGQSR